MSISNTLTTIEESPTADVVLYDGNCVFCTRGVRQLQSFDGRKRLAFVSIHDPLVAERFPDLRYEQLMTQMYVIPHREPNARYGGGAAIRYLTRRLPKLWIFAPIFHIPFSLPIWQFLYRQVAQRRYRIANANQTCENGSCSLHLEKKPST